MGRGKEPHTAIAAGLHGLAIFQGCDLIHGNPGGPHGAEHQLHSLPLSRAGQHIRPVSGGKGEAAATHGEQLPTLVHHTDLLPAHLRDAPDQIPQQSGFSASRRADEKDGACPQILLQAGGKAGDIPGHPDAQGMELFKPGDTSCLDDTAPADADPVASPGGEISLCQGYGGVGGIPGGHIDNVIEILRPNPAAGWVPLPSPGHRLRHLPQTKSELQHLLVPHSGVHGFPKPWRKQLQ